MLRMIQRHLVTQVLVTHLREQLTYHCLSVLKDYCEDAKSCQERKGSAQLESLPEVTLPLTKVSLDKNDLYSSNSGFCYVLTLSNAYSRFVVFTLLRDKCAATVTKVMLKYVLTFGAPNLFYSNRGKEFSTHIFWGAVCADL